MRLGVISDTHGMLRPQVFEAFAGVDHILHAGDVGPAELLTELEAIAPVTAVWGNCDGWDVRHRVPEQVATEFEGLPFVLLHGHRVRPLTPEQLAVEFPEALVIIHGHTHRPHLTLVEGAVTVMNPGGAGARRFDFPASVGILELEPGIPPRGRLLPLTGADED